MQMQDEAGVDMAYFYTADDSPWSMFDKICRRARQNLLRLQGIQPLVAGP